MKIRFKILAITYTILVLFAIAVGSSVLLQKRTQSELGGIADYHTPITALTASFDVSTYEFELELRRLAREKSLSPAALKSHSEHIETLIIRMDDGLKQAELLLNQAVQDPRNNVTDRVILARIQGAMGNMREQLQPFAALGRRTMELIAAGKEEEMVAALAQFKQFESIFGPQLAKARADLEAFTQKSVAEANAQEGLNLWISSGLFALAAAIGLALALVITRHIVGALQQLIQRTEALERGDLTEALPVTVNDEIGQLTTAFNRMVEELRLKERIKATFGRYVDPRVVNTLLANPANNPDAAERRLATVFFSDIKGYSAISEQITPVAMVNLLNRYFTLASTAVREQQGIVDKYIGDAVMAFWTSPFSASDEAQAIGACHSALTQIQALETLRGELPDILGLRRNVPELWVRMGIATGDVVVGTVGSAISKSYTVIGDTVNIASRIEGLNKAYDTAILITEATEALARPAIEAREIDLVVVAGKTEPIRVYELLALKGGLSAAQAQLRDTFEQGLRAYRLQDWPTAAERFAQCLELDPHDGPSRTFAARVQEFVAQPPGANWDGVWHATSK